MTARGDFVTQCAKAWPHLPETFDCDAVVSPAKVEAIRLHLATSEDYQFTMNASAAQRCWKQ